MLGHNPNSLLNTKLLLIKHAVSGLLKCWSTFHVTVGLQQNTRDSVIGVGRISSHGWNRRLFVCFFLPFAWKIKSATGCRYVYDFTRLRAVQVDLTARKSLKTACPFDQNQPLTNLTKPPNKVDIDILASGKTYYNCKIKELLCTPN